MSRNQYKPSKFRLNSSLIAYHNPKSDLASQFRVIRNNVRYLFAPSGLYTLAVTSPSEGEGKSTVAANLAVSLAQQGERVLLVDMNFKNPFLHYVFGRDAAPGLSDVLAGYIDISDAVRRTELSNLSFLSTGSATLQAIENLDSKKMNELVMQLKSMYDVVVFDCPSVLDTPETIVLAAECSGVILVLKRGTTKHEDALQAKHALEFGHANLIGAVLNR